MNDPRLLSKRELDELRARLRYDDDWRALLDHIDAQTARIRLLEAELRACDQVISGEYDLIFPESEPGESKPVKTDEVQVRPDFELDESEDAE